MQHQNDDSFLIPPPIPRSQTPPNQPSRGATQQPLCTPRRSGTPRSTTNVTEHRSIILEQMKDEMVCCDTWDDGFNLYLPDIGIADKDIDAAVAKLKEKGLLCAIVDRESNQRLQFTEFRTNPACIETPNEKTLYRPLVDICEVLGGLRLVEREDSSCELVQAPDSYNTAETPGANFKVDAYLKLRHSTMPGSDPSPTKIPTADLAVPSEYKKKRDKWEVVANRGQLLGTTTFCMNDDPRRTHIYGITIEDSKMTVWYFSRSHSAKSPEFDFSEDPETYVRVMLSFLFATEKELGYDPTIKRRLDSDPNSNDKKLCYVYMVEDSPQDQAKKRERYFKTQGAIFEHRSLCTTGRATRVWKVVEVGSFDDLQPLDGSTTMVLKDVWLDSDSKTEGQNLNAIFKELQKIADSLKKAEKRMEIFDGLDQESEDKLKLCLEAGSWDRYFLTKVSDWQGCESKEVPPAARSDPTLFYSSTSTITPSSHPHSDGTRATPYQAINPVPVVRKRLPRRYSPKRQYRIIFEEVCEALHDVQKLHDVATALLDSVFALQLMFLAGWVHRDISSGNIYAFRFQENGTDEVRGILADLEYAKRFEPARAEGSSDPKTGTAFFMAVEIQRQRLFYIPRQLPRILKSDDPGRSIGVIHNFEHDMESIFWLFLWILLTRFHPEGTAKEEKERKGAVSNIFQNTSLCPLQREEVFTNWFQLQLFLQQWLNPELHTLITGLTTLQSTLMDAYLERQLNFSDLASYARLYHHVSDMLKSCQTLADGLGPVGLMQGPTPGPQRLTHVIKRKADVGGGDGSESLSKVLRGDGSTDAASSRTLHRQNPEISEHEESGQSAKAG